MKKLSRFLEKYTSSIDLNANDTFGYACSENVTVYISELPGIIELEELFGYNGVLAFMSFKSDQDPLGELVTEKYKEAKKYMKENYYFSDNFILPKKYTWKEPYDEKGFVIFEGDNPLDFIK